MAFKQATIKEIRKRFDQAGELNGLDAVVEIEDLNAQKTTETIAVNKDDVANASGATVKDKIATAIKIKVKAKYLAWAQSQKFADKDPISTTNAVTIQTELGFNVISQIDNI